MRVVVAAVVVVSAFAGVNIAAPIGAFDPDSAAHASVVLTPAGGFDNRVPQLLASIQRVEPTELPSYLAQHSKEISATLVTPGAAQEVGGWWSSLGSAERTALERRAPEFLGNLEGIPFEVRGSANLSLLHKKLDVVNARVRASGSRASASLKSQLDGLNSITKALRSPAGAPKRTLTTFHPNGVMRAAIAVGDVDTADDVSILVPGMFYSVVGQLADWTQTAQDLYTQQRAWLQRLGEQDRTVATVAWLGYRTPGLMSVLSLKDAQAGATQLAASIAGIRATRGGDEPYLSVLAHSYGSTAALLALQDKTMKVDALAVLGSPGSVAPSVHDLDVPANRVFVGAALLDPIAGSGYFGTDPGSRGFGARPLGVVGGIDPIDGHLMLPAIGHNGYFDPGTESMRNLALIAIGDCALITT